MSEEPLLSADEIGRAFDTMKARIEAERRARFVPFGIAVNCLWPASRLFHQHSALGPSWSPVLTVAEVEALTKAPAYKRYPGAERTVLPRPPALTANIEQTIRSRRSRSEFSDRPVALAELAKLFEFGCGVTCSGEIGRRAAPSGGALYPVETYALAFGVEDLPTGLYHYCSEDHVLEHVRLLPGIEAARPFLPPRLLEGRPPLMLALSVVFARTQMKYLERGYRFALLEAGHIAQNIVLAATALGMGSVCVGGFWDEPFNDLLGFEPTKEAVVYSILVGHTAVASGSGEA